MTDKGVLDPLRIAVGCIEYRVNVTQVPIVARTIDVPCLHHRLPLHALRAASRLRLRKVRALPLVAFAAAPAPRWAFSADLGFRLALLRFICT